MKKLLLITGDLATGKSTFANILSNRYEANFFYKDSIKEVLGDNIGFSNREENKKLSNASLGLMYFIFNEFTRFNKDIILESNFHTNELETLHKIANEHDYDVLTLVLRGDIDILHKRYLNRIHKENRHPVHLSTTLDVYDDFKKFTIKSRQEEIIGNLIQINASDFSYQTDKELLSKIDNFMEGEY